MYAPFHPLCVGSPSHLAHHGRSAVVTKERSLDLVAPTVECRKIWVKALNLLLSKARASDKDDAIDDYLEKLWNKADEDRSASLTYDECCKVNFLGLAHHMPVCAHVDHRIVPVCRSWRRSMCAPSTQCRSAKTR